MNEEIQMVATAVTVAAVLTCMLIGIIVYTEPECPVGSKPNWTQITGWVCTVPRLHR